MKTEISPRVARFATPSTRVLLSLSLMVLTLAGCEPDPKTKDQGSTKQEPSAARVLRLAATTSTRDSGLLDILLPVFEKANHCRVDLIAVGTGAAIKLGEDGDVDAVLCHAHAAEDAFMKDKHGVRHEEVMHNHFLIAGPSEDPAGIKKLTAAQAFQQIAAGQHTFVSRGDDSGTHMRELLMWPKKQTLDWDAYLESGQGMGATLVIADEKNGYVLTDEASWLKQADHFQLQALLLNSDELKNPYAIMVVNPDKHESIDSELANKFANFLISSKAQKLIRELKINGKQLFQPLTRD